MIRLGLPSKGRLMDEAFAWFLSRGIGLSRAGSERDYAARSDFPGLEPVLLSAGEIPRELETGRIHLGVTGSELLERTQMPADELLDVINTLLDWGYVEAASARERVAAGDFEGENFEINPGFAAEIKADSERDHHEGKKDRNCLVGCFVNHCLPPRAAISPAVGLQSMP